MVQDHVVRFNHLSYSEQATLVKQVSLGDALYTLFVSAETCPMLYTNSKYIILPNQIDLRDKILVCFQGRLVPLSEMQLKLVADPFLLDEGVCVYRVIDTEHKADTYNSTDRPLIISLQLKGLLLRFGLGLRTLEESKEHLHGRSSQGVQTMQHQLVKKMFADLLVSYQTFISSMEQDLMVETHETEERIVPSASTVIKYWHDELDRVTNQAGKLMGGHGYLLAGSIRLVYLSKLIRTMMEK